jgi:hypothetical protein
LGKSEGSKNKQGVILGKNETHSLEGKENFIDLWIKFCTPANYSGLYTPEEFSVISNSLTEILRKWGYLEVFRKIVEAENPVPDKELKLQRGIVYGLNKLGFTVYGENSDREMVWYPNYPDSHDKLNSFLMKILEDGSASEKTLEIVRRKEESLRNKRIKSLEQKMIPRFKRD